MTSGRIARLAVVAVLTALAFLPVADWIAPSVAAPDFGPLARSWAISLAVALVAVGAFALAGGQYVQWPLRPDSDRLAGVGSAVLPALLLAAFAAYVFVALEVFDGLPLHLDSMTQAVQARIFAMGRLWIDTPQHPEFTSTLHMVDHDGRTYSQFPPGWAAALAAGTLFEMPWIVAPIFGALGVASAYALARGLGESKGFAFLVALVLAASPWYLFNAGSQMNHLPALTLILAGSAALVGLHADDTSPRRSLAFAAGTLLGAAAWVRPLEAAAFALPAVVWTTVREGHRWPRSIALASGLLATGAGLLAFNTVLNGAPLTWAYDLQWGSAHGLGFHEAPFGPPHTPTRGLGLLNKYLLQMQIVLFEGGTPALLAPLAALGLTRRLSSGDRYLLAGSAAVLLGYFAYWHDGDYLGPRFLLPLAPVAVLWTLRLPRALAEVGGAPMIVRGSGVAIAVMLLTGATMGTPNRWLSYARMSPQRRVDIAVLRNDPQFRNAIILVPASWGTQVRARMWARGVPRRDTEWIYERTDLCALDYAVSQLERRGETDPIASTRSLMPLTADSLLVQATTLSPDTTQRMRIGARYPPPCEMRLLEERGEISMLHFIPRTPDGPQFVRDMHERNQLVLGDSAARVYRLERLPGGMLAPREIALDSARIQWNAWLLAAAN